MVINFTEHELGVMSFYMRKALIDAEGGKAIGITSDQTCQAIKSIQEKISKASKACDSK